MANRTIALIGCTGFIGEVLAERLTREGYRLKALTRRRERAKRLIVMPRLELVETDVHDAAALTAELAGADAVVNMAGILNERRRGEFDRVHAELPAAIVSACAANGIGRYLHMSALKATAEAPSRYLRSKAAGEAAALAGAQHGIDVTVFRPSVVFGPRDDFFNRFAALLALTPVGLPLACASARFAPVHVGDVVEAFARALHDKSTHGNGYNLCGPEQYTLLELVRYCAQVSGRNRSIWPLGKALSRAQAMVLQRVPGKPFTVDNYLSMQVASTCDGDDLGRLGIEATSIESVVPAYLGTRNRAGQYHTFRTRAGRH